MSAETWNSALWSAWSAVEAAEAVMAGAPSAYALCRPPGHHAFADVAGGFCFINNSAVAAQVLRKNSARVAILDVGIERAAKVAADIGGIAVQCDVSSGDSATAAIAEAAEKLGPSRILVNCAGIAIGVKTIGKDGPHPLDQYRN
ncbi:SDR family oxidoreductase, partial [Mesorhizobium sp. M2C.T.Ca.TU.009.01.2.1]